MKYYVTSDIHGFYTEFIDALTKAGWFEDTSEKKLVILGDLFDRGKEAVKLEKFVVDLIKQDQVILIKGNHEDLFEYFIYEDDAMPVEPHISNCTYSTALQLTRIRKWDALEDNITFGLAASLTKFNKKIIPAMKNYYETDHYVFVHGWIPCIENRNPISREIAYYPLEDWRNASEVDFAKSRWLNGMDAYKTIKVPGKTVICGHWNASYGHFKYENGPFEYDDDANHTPFYDAGIIAIDA